MQYTIRAYQKEDRPAVRRISFETAFQDISRAKIFTDDEIIADALTLYYTDLEPESCLVAESEKRVVGYLIGARDIRRVENSRLFVFLTMAEKAFRHKTFSNRINRGFALQVLKGFLAGEFRAPDLSDKFPATLHMNLDWDARNRGIGSALMETYLRYLRGLRIPGIQASTFSEKAKDFFIKKGFRILFAGRRSFLRPYFGRTTGRYILGREV